MALSSLTKLLTKPVGSEARKCCPPRKASSAAPCYCFKVEMPSSLSQAHSPLQRLLPVLVNQRIKLDRIYLTWTSQLHWTKQVHCLSALARVLVLSTCPHEAFKRKMHNNMYNLKHFLWEVGKMEEQDFRVETERFNCRAELHLWCESEKTCRS